MNTVPATPGSVAPQAADPGAAHDGPAAAPPEHVAAPSHPIPPDIARLFRRTLAQGRMHPLMPLLLHYRQGQGPTP